MRIRAGTSGHIWILKDGREVYLSAKDIEELHNFIHNYLSEKPKEPVNPMEIL
jgi:hypothetical protein